jgi:membrane protein YqaA with SNARE-associated domain
MGEFEHLAREIGPHAATLIVGFLSGFIPIVNAELFLIAMAALMPTTQAALLIGLTCASGQMVAKVLIFFAASGAMNLPVLNKIPREKIDSLSARMKGMGNKTNAFLFISASLGLPPFLVVSVVAGLLKLNPYSFAIIGWVGRALRFGTIALFPQLVKKL